MAAHFICMFAGYHWGNYYINLRARQADEGVEEGIAEHLIRVAGNKLTKGPKRAAPKKINVDIDDGSQALTTPLPMVMGEVVHKPHVDVHTPTWFGSPKPLVDVHEPHVDVHEKTWFGGPKPLVDVHEPMAKKLILAQLDDATYSSVAF